MVVVVVLDVVVVDGTVVVVVVCGGLLVVVVVAGSRGAGAGGATATAGALVVVLADGGFVATGPPLWPDPALPPEAGLGPWPGRLGTVPAGCVVARMPVSLAASTTPASATTAPTIQTVRFNNASGYFECQRSGGAGGPWAVTGLVGGPSTAVAASAGTGSASRCVASNGPRWPLSSILSKYPITAALETACH